MSKASKTDDKFEYRVANSSDETDILEILEEVAPEIPLSLDTPEKQDVIKVIITECCASGESWVATDAHGAVVGFALARPDHSERFFQENDALYLPYIGVNKDKRKRGIFGNLLEKLKAKGVPLTARVKHTNQSGMAGRLVKRGFTKMKSNPNEVRLKWEFNPSE
jgi:hypothetical protein